jgi:hypothetical protein
MKLRIIADAYSTVDFEPYQFCGNSPDDIISFPTSELYEPRIFYHLAPARIEDFLLDRLTNIYQDSEFDLNFSLDSTSDKSISDDVIYDCINIGQYGEHTAFYILKLHKVVCLTTDYSCIIEQVQKTCDLFFPYIEKEIKTLLKESPGFWSELSTAIQEKLRPEFQNIGSDFGFLE